MTTVLQIGNQTLTAQEILPLLAKYQMLPQLVREIIIEQAIAPFKITAEEEEIILKQFEQQQQITNDEQRQAWLQQKGFTPEQFKKFAIRQGKVAKFKQETWGEQLESYFLQRKSQLDRVVYYLLRTNNQGIAQEIYFRIQEGEQSFADLAKQYSQGPEAQSGGLVGPVELHTLHPALAKMLSTSQPSQLLPPTRLGEWLVIVRLEKFISAQLDERMKQRLLTEKFSAWLEEETKKVSLPNFNPTLRIVK